MALVVDSTIRGIVADFQRAEDSVEILVDPEAPEGVWRVQNSGIYIVDQEKENSIRKGLAQKMMGEPEHNRLVARISVERGSFKEITSDNFEVETIGSAE